MCMTGVVVRQELRHRAECAVRDAWEELKQWKDIEDAVRAHRADPAIHAIVVAKEVRFAAALDVLADAYDDSQSSTEKPEQP